MRPGSAVKADSRRLCFARQPACIDNRIPHRLRGENFVGARTIHGSPHSDERADRRDPHRFARLHIGILVELTKVDGFEHVVHPLELPRIPQQHPAAGGVRLEKRLHHVAQAGEPPGVCPCGLLYRAAYGHLEYADRNQAKGRLAARVGFPDCFLHLSLELGIGHAGGIDLAEKIEVQPPVTLYGENTGGHLAGSGKGELIGIAGSYGITGVRNGK